MPYIKEKARNELDTGSRPPETAGELNYGVTALVDEYLIRKGVSYANINEAIGVLECAKLELYRRIAGPFEDFKRKHNGEVYNVINLATGDES